MKDKPDCYKCKYRCKIVENAHSRCLAKKASVKGDDYGIKNGWFMWPFNFDPVWLESCNQFKELKDLGKNQE